MEKLDLTFRVKTTCGVEQLMILNDGPFVTYLFFNLFENYNQDQFGFPGIEPFGTSFTSRELRKDIFTCTTILRIEAHSAINL